MHQYLWCCLFELNISALFFLSLVWIFIGYCTYCKTLWIKASAKCYVMWITVAIHFFFISYFSFCCYIVVACSTVWWCSWVPPLTRSLALIIVHIPYIRCLIKPRPRMYLLRQLHLFFNQNITLLFFKQTFKNCGNKCYQNYHKTMH